MAQQRPEDVSTICVLGLPEDCSDREFRNFFACADGYESSVVHAKHGCSVGFARFRTPENAAAVVQRLTNYFFVEGSNRPISVSMANSQLDEVRVRRRQQAESQKKGSPPIINPIGLQLPNAASLPFYHFPTISGHLMPGSYGPQHPIASPHGPHDDRANNSTIYLAGFAEDCKEVEVIGIVSGLAEYSKLSFTARPGTHPLVFVKFQTHKGARHAVEYLNNRTLYTTTGTQVQLSAAFAKKELMDTR